MEPANTTPQPKGSGPLVPALLVVNSLLLAGVLAMLFLRTEGGVGAKEGEKAPEAAAAEAAPPAAEGASGQPAPGTIGPIVRLPDFVIHLRNPESDRYLRLVIELELGKDTDREAIATYMAPIRDAFIGYLSDRTLEEMRGTEGMDRLRKGLHRILGEVVPRSVVRTVYITEFMVQ